MTRPVSLLNQHIVQLRRQRLVACLLAACLMLIGANAKARPRDDTASTSALADELAREGETAANAGNLEEAQDKLAQAFALKPAYDIAGNLGGVEYGLRRYRDAATHLSHSIRNYPLTGDDKARRATQALLEKARKQVCSITLRASPDGASLTVDGEELGRATLDNSQYVAPGQHTISASAWGHRRSERQLKCEAGSSTSMQFNLVAQKAGGGFAVSGNAEPRSVAPSWPMFLGGGLAVVGVGVGVAGFGIHSHEQDRRWTLLEGSAPQSRSTVCAPPVSEGNADACNRVGEYARRARTGYNVGIVATAIGGGLALFTLAYTFGYSVSLGANERDRDDLAARLQLTPRGAHLVGTF